MPRKLIYEVVLDSAAYSRQIKKVEKETAAFAGSTKKLDREISHASRGALAGSGIFKGMGRSLAFASGGFLAFSSGAEFLRKSVDAAREAAVAQRSLAAQMKASGESFDQNRDRIEKVALSYSKFGFNNDEVVKSLTVLERGTGNINKAFAVQGLTADIARAKNIDLAAAATVVAKVFGGQETALRRAVPGLAKNAHGWDLIRLAQAKMAGQAAANTTATERFGSTLHNTEEIIGTALLPTLNKTIEALGKWLRHMNESGDLQRNVTKVTKTLAEAFDVARDALHGLNAVTGSTKDTLKLLFAAFVAFKTVKLVTAFADMATNIGLIGRNAKTATGEVTALNTATGQIGAGVVAAALTAERIKAELEDTKKVGEQLRKAQGGQRIFGTSFEGHEAGSKPFVSTQGVFKGQMVAVRTIDGVTWVIPVGALKAMMGNAAEVKPTPDTGFRSADLSPPKVAKAYVPTVGQRNTWFDALIGRQLARVQDVDSLKAQNARLAVIAAEIQKRLATTKDITRRLALEAQYLDIQNTIRGNTQQIADKAAADVQARADRQKAAVQAARDEQLAWAQYGIAKAETTKTLQDDLKAARHNLIVVTAQAAIGKQTAEKAQAVLDAQTAYNAKVQEVADAAKARRQKALDAATNRGLRAGAKLSREIDWAQLNIDKAGVTQTLKDNIAAQKFYNALLLRQIKEHGLTVDRARQLWQGRQDLKNLLNQGKKTSAARKNPYGQAGYWVDGMFFATNVGGGGAGFSSPTATTQPAMPFSGAGVNIGNLNLYGVQDVPTLENELVKRAATRPQPRRGP